MAKRLGHPKFTFLGLDPCAICGFEGRGFGFRLDLSGLYPHYVFCSMPCVRIGEAIAKSNGGKIEKMALSDIENHAIVDARLQLWEAAQRVGIADHIEKMSPEQIDDLVKSVVIGFQASIQRAMGRGEVPF
jgi:hypothetical protein